MITFVRRAMISVCCRVLAVCVLVIISDELVLGQNICISQTSYTSCDNGYECCDNNTRCCANGLSFGAIIGIVFGVLFMLTICIVCAVIVTKKKNHNVIRTSFSNQPNAQNVTIANIGNGVNGYGLNGQYTSGQYGYGFGQPAPIPGMIAVAPPPYSQCGPQNQPGPPMMPASQPGMTYSSVGSPAGPMCRPLAPAYSTPARPMFKSNAHNMMGH